MLKIRGAVRISYGVSTIPSGILYIRSALFLLQSLRYSNSSAKDSLISIQMSLALSQGSFILWLRTEAFFNSGFTKLQIKTDLWTPSCLLDSVACSGWGKATQPLCRWLLSARGAEHKVTLTKNYLLLVRNCPRLITIKAICRSCVDFMVQGEGTLNYRLSSVFSSWNTCAFWFVSLC